MIRSMMESHAIDVSNPYSVLLPVTDELLRLYDDSVWSIRNHISQWEAVSRAVKCLVADYA